MAMNDISDFKRIGQSRILDKGKIVQYLHQIHHLHVPHIDVQQQPIPSAISLVNMQTRFFLKPVDEVEEDETLALLTEISESTKSRGGDQGLDLGVVALQRIIQQLRGLQSKGRANIFDPHASRAAGLVPYTDYLHGKQKNPEY